MNIIAIAGPARSGKDTIGDYVRENLNYCPLSFAAPIRLMISNLLGCRLSQLEKMKDAHIDELGYSPRQLMQTLGTEWGRNTLHPDFWVKLVQRDIRGLREAEDCPGVVITDCRFENEATMIREEGGVICHLTRADAPEVSEHISEAGLISDGSDFHIKNNGTRSELHSEIERMLMMYPTLTQLRR